MCVCNKKGHVRQYSRQEGGRGGGHCTGGGTVHAEGTVHVQKEVHEGGGGTVQEKVLYMQEVMYTCRMRRRGGEEGRAGQGRGEEARQGRARERRAGQGRAGSHEVAAGSTCRYYSDLCIMSTFYNE